jgi:hypothetical protein
MPAELYAIGAVLEVLWLIVCAFSIAALVLVILGDWLCGKD